MLQNAESIVIESMWTDLRDATRTWMRMPGATLLVLVTLALGIGINVAVFTVANAVLFTDFRFVEKDERVLYVERPGAGFSYRDFRDWQARARSFEGMAAATAWLATLGDRTGAPERCAVTVISSNGFRLIGQRPLVGRDFAPSDTVSGAPPVAILSHALWMRRYGGDPGVVGRTVRLEVAGSVLISPTATVIGVMPPDFSFPFDQDVWVPLTPPANEAALDKRTITFFFGRVVDGVSVSQARAEMDTIGRRLQVADSSASPRPVAVQSFSQHFIGSRARTIFVSMLGAVSCVLLIACANVANLMWVRTIGRARDLSLRMALGASRLRIVRHVLAESVLLAAGGGLLGCGIAKAGVKAYELTGHAPYNYKHYVDFSMDSAVLGYLIATSMAAGVLCGLLPALKLSAVDLDRVLRSGSRGLTGSRVSQRASSLVVAGEIAIAIVLLVAAGIMVRSYLNIHAVDVGVNTERVLVSDLGLPLARYGTPELQGAFWDRLKERLESVPRVESIAIGDRYPTQGTRVLAYELAGAPPTDEDHRALVPTLIVGPDYFRTLGAIIRAGREFARTDDAAGAAVVIVNEAFANRHWPGASALGKRIRVFQGSEAVPWRTVVGVVSDVVQHDLARDQSNAAVYLPLKQDPETFMYVLARTDRAPAALKPLFDDEIGALDSGLAASFVSLDERIGRAYRDRGLYGALLVTFAAVGLAMAAVGLYALVAHAVGGRTQEIGVRTAMGATARDIGQLVFAFAARTVGAGLLAGVAASFVVGRLLASQLVHVSPFDPVTVIVATAVLVAAAALGCVIPARRAIRVDPAVALRHE